MALILLALLLATACDGVIPFDHDVWMRSGSWEQGSFPRRDMAKDLINRQTLVGKSEEDVVGLLGKPSTDWVYTGERQLMYWLGPDRHGGIDSEWLRVKMDGAGHVTECEIYED
jgi:outer membrane protein assembly factor BamE (lipoprotein component of BamABCDE complex)